VLVDKPAMARPHWSRSQATAHARVLPVVGLVVTKRTKSALATPSAIPEIFVSQFISQAIRRKDLENKSL
jgi:hypothetical protein